MLYNREQRTAAYKKLPQEAQDFVMSSGTTNLISELLKKSNLSQESLDIADSEILYAMLGLQTLDTAISNIATTSKRSAEQLTALKSDLQIKIFSQIEELKKNSANASPTEPEPTLKSIPEVKTVGATPLTPSVVVENDLPMVLPNEKPHDSTPEVSVSSQKKPKVEQPLTFEERKKLVPNIPDNKVHYDGGKDPYREPI